MELVPRVLNCFKAGALSTGCEYDISISHVYLDLQPCTKLEEYYQEHCQSRWGSEGYVVSERSSISASTDFVSMIQGESEDIADQVSVIGRRHIPSAGTTSHVPPPQRAWRRIPSYVPLSSCQCVLPLIVGYRLQIPGHTRASRKGQKRIKLLSEPRAQSPS